MWRAKWSSARDPASSDIECIIASVVGEPCATSILQLRWAWTPITETGKGCLCCIWPQSLIEQPCGASLDYRNAQGYLAEQNATEDKQGQLRMSSLCSVTGGAHATWFDLDRRLIFLRGCSIDVFSDLPIFKTSFISPIPGFPARVGVGFEREEAQVQAMAGAAGGFVTRAFESILKECLSAKKYPDLQSAVNSYLAAKDNDQNAVNCDPKMAPSVAPASLGETEGDDSNEGAEPDKHPTDDPADAAGHVEKSAVPGVSITTALESAGHTLEGAEVAIVLTPLRLAFETKNIKILEPALDCHHKLIAYDHLEGDPGLDGGKNSPLFTDVLTMACGCIDNSSPDSTILLVLKVLLTAVASTKFRVHGEPLLGVFRVCYNIALHSKNPINQATSKAMLTQMISIVFRRMETDQVSVTSTAVELNLTSKVDEASSNIVNEKALTSGDALTQAKETSLVSVEELQTLAGGADIKVEAANISLHDMMMTLLCCVDVLERGRSD
ncbi:hypothetical protein MLD38_015113 [Melastoma candidum]|uniref:Uncharacterized protein n=1 Tax=Melastoma candidum TaxID=119954 RepID=A0ACB9RGX7_9MYRT|nr:hypothetical protein MLD38_015113 [Melastoma candidum]